MLKLFNLLTIRERRVILMAGLFLFFVILFHFSVLKNKIKAYARIEEALSSKKAELISLERSFAEKKSEHLRWREAFQDMDYLDETYFYSGKTSIHHIRMDLNKIFDKTGIEVESIKYEYNEYPEKNIQKITLSFSIEGTYRVIKKFLFEIENLERFLYVDKITFQDIERESQKVKLGLFLAAYYEI